MDVEMFKMLLEESKKDLDFEEATLGLSDNQLEELQELDDCNGIINSVIHEVFKRLNTRLLFMEICLKDKNNV